MMNFIERYRTYIGIFLVIVILAGVGILLWNKKQAGNGGSKTAVGKIRVDIEGGVSKPGVYELKDGAILEDLLKMAEGFSESADKSKIAEEVNRARLLVDGEKIYIPLKGEVAGAGNEATSTSVSQKESPSQTISGKININTATADQLDTLPGIGPAYAGRIIDYRTQNGKFKSIEEIQEVKGIGPKTFEKLKNLITI